MQAGGSRLTLARKKLLAISSLELSVHVQRLAAERPLSAREQEEYARQRRLVLNREYARRSRHRKKRELRELEEENEALRERVWQLEEAAERCMRKAWDGLCQPVPSICDEALSRETPCALTLGECDWL